MRFRNARRPGARLDDKDLDSAAARFLERVHVQPGTYSEPQYVMRLASVFNLVDVILPVDATAEPASERLESDFLKYEKQQRLHIFEKLGLTRLTVTAAAIEETVKERERRLRQEANNEEVLWCPFCIHLRQLSKSVR